MNERIKELAQQVDACYIPRYDMWQMDTESLEKFAELIIKECVRAAETTPEMRKSGAGNRIKEVFGVEE